jgi:DNA polymerase-1
VIGTLANQGAQAGMHVAIVSPDKDMFQLLQPGVQILRPPKKDNKIPLMGGMVPYNAALFEQEQGLKPSQWSDYLALVGDSSDNVPGVKGVGPKTAVPLLQQFGDVEGLLANTATIEKKAWRNKFEAEGAADSARLSKRLVTIQTSMNLPPLRSKIPELVVSPPSDTTKAAVKAAFDHLQFKQHARRLDSVWAKLERAQRH